MAPIIEAHNLKKIFRTGHGKNRRVVEALRGVDLTVEEGEFFGLLGPNGAGKTTLIQCLTTLLLPTDGGGSINGYDILLQPREVRASIGCMLTGERSIYWKLTGRENLDYFGALYHMPKPERKERIGSLIDLLDLKDFLDRRVETYSSGQKMKIAFAKSIITDPPVLVLDEPTITLDVHAARELRSIVADLNRKGTTVVYTTHLMFEAEELCTRVAIIDDGSIKAQGTVEELKANIEGDRVITIGIHTIPQEVISDIETLGGVKRCILDQRGDEREILITCRRPKEILPEVIQALSASGALIKSVEVESVTLETAFLRLTGKTLVES